MDWTRGQTIGRGSSAAVSLATAASGEVFAVKSNELSESGFLQREQKILSLLKSPYVVRYIGHDNSREHNRVMYNMFMEYVTEGTIIEAVRNVGEKLSESAVRFYTREIVKGVEYLHSVGLVHCDIKGKNILVGEKGLKIADFGCARWANEAAPIGGTPMFMSPEVARGEEQSFPCDIWAIGCTVVEIANGGSSPWSTNAADPLSLLYRIGYSRESPEIPSFLSEQATDFLSKCFIRDPKQRWTVAQLLKHPFLDEQTDSSSTTSKKVQESKFDASFSPTSILEQGIWNSLQESHTSSNLDDHSSVENLDDRIQRLSLLSGDPRWNSDESCWITVRGDDPIVDDGEAQADVSCRIIISCRDINLNNLGPCKKIRKITRSTSISSKSLVALSNHIFERHKENLLFPSIPIF